jgi:hypothetical protein
MDADFLEFLRSLSNASSLGGNITDDFTMMQHTDLDLQHQNTSESNAGGGGWEPGPLDHFDFVPEELPAGMLSAFTFLYVVIIFLGLGGNATTILVVALNREMRTVTNVFLVSLAVSDALIAGVNMPAQLKFYTHNEWTLGEHACKLTGYVQGVVIVASILTLTSLALDR